MFKLVGEKRLFDISSLDEWRTQAYENANCLKKKLKDGMTKAYAAKRVKHANCKKVQGCD